MKSIIATMALAALPLAGAWAQDAPRRQLLFPFARHGNIGDAHRLDDGIEGKSFFGGHCFLYNML